MTEEKKQAIMNCETFDELLDLEYGSQGTPKRIVFETEAEAFCLAETLRDHPDGAIISLSRRGQENL